MQEKKQVACIGSGVMGTALMKAVAQTIGGACIGFTDSQSSRAVQAAQQIGATVYASNVEAAQKADYLFLAVKPSVLHTVLREIQGVLGDRQLLISMAAGWSIERIKAVLERGSQPVLRIMPNTPVLVGEGVIACTASQDVSDDQSATVKALLAHGGTVDTVEEHIMDAVTALSGSGPAFVALFVEALSDGGVLNGLSREKALNYALQTVIGSATLMKNRGIHPGTLKDMVCSPAGTTIAGVTALEHGAFRAAVIDAVDASFRRAKALEPALK
ncbi:MAG: pyrroline-5-carboxylate reductase [Treponema sp.]|jgi:pyrroline-5-carboxylate reductase|nr:pyrroline-5-carboxylate reductase [Treponema sp.]